MENKNKADAKRIIERLKAMQEEGDIFPCPRCGHLRMHKDHIKNSLSRELDVYICNECGTDEAMRELINKPLSITEWSLAKTFLR